MELNNLSNCEQNCSKKCYIKLEDGTLIEKLCKEALRRVFNDCPSIVAQELEKYNLTLENFYKLRDKLIRTNDDKSDKNFETIKAIRNVIGYPSENEVLERASTKLDFYTYIENTGKILGFIDRAKHLNNLRTAEDYINNLALPEKYNPEDPIYLIRFILRDPEDLKENLVIPFDEPGDEPNTEKCTNTGFTASYNENIIPENKLVSPSEVKKGSQAFTIDLNNPEELVKVYNDKEKKFVPYNGPTIVKKENGYFEIDRNGIEKSLEVDESKIIKLIPAI